MRLSSLLKFRTIPGQGSAGTHGIQKFNRFLGFDDGKSFHGYPPFLE
jgi:hypothetical protein